MDKSEDSHFSALKSHSFPTSLTPYIHLSEDFYSTLLSMGFSSTVYSWEGSVSLMQKFKTKQC